MTSAAGPDGNLWFTEFNRNRIGRITPSGVVTEFSVGITAGADPYGHHGRSRRQPLVHGINFSGNRIGRITPRRRHRVQRRHQRRRGPVGITAGPDGNLWFTEFSATGSDG